MTNEIRILVEQAKAGSRSAYGILVERFQATVYAVALARLRDPSEAQELAQEVFIHALRKLDQLRDADCFAGWLRQITVRMALNRVTRRAPATGNEHLDNTHSAEPAPLDTLVRSEERSELWDSLKRLKATDRETLVSFYIRGRSLKQMSREFATPVGTIKRRLHVARNRLRKEMETEVPV